MDDDWLAAAGIYISQETLEKLNHDHNVTETEVEEAMFNATHPYLIDKRRWHRTVPPSFWFIAPTADGRPLKVVFKPYYVHALVHVKSAYEPEDYEIEFYNSQR